MRSERGGVLVLIDGPAGAGKTTLAASLAQVHPEATVLHMDDLYPGWDGLEDGVARLASLVEDWRQGREGTYRCYDWAAGRPGPERTVPPGPLLIVEGVGAGGTGQPSELLIWIEAPADVRRQRAATRGDFADQWDSWAQAEARHFARARTRERASQVFDTTRQDPAVELSRTAWFAPPPGSD